MQLVADVQNAATLSHQLAQHHKQFVHRLRGEHRGGLVQNQQARFGEQGPDDFYPLHLAHAQGMDRAIGFNVQPILSSLVHDAIAHLGQGPGRIQTQPDVLRHTQAVEQAEVLKHHGNAQCSCHLRVADVHHLAFKHNAPCIGLGGTKDHLHQGGFTGTVFTQHRVNFARHDTQRHLVVGHHRRIALGDAL